MTLRGTEVTMYDFAHYNETILGNESIIVYNDNNPANHPTVIEKFKNRFDKVYNLVGPDFNFILKPVKSPVLMPVGNVAPALMDCTAAASFMVLKCIILRPPYCCSLPNLYLKPDSLSKNLTATKRSSLSP